MLSGAAQSKIFLGNDLDTMNSTDGSKVVVEQHGSFGRSAYATSPIKAGELVVCEQPLLHYCVGRVDASLAQLLQLARQQLQTPEHAASSSACEDVSWEQACVQLLAFCTAPATTQHRVLNDMFNAPEGPGINDSALIRRTALQASVLVSLAGPVIALLRDEGSWSDGSLAAEVLSSAAEMQRMLLSFELNAHMTDSG
jgi:hypothetical protein